MELPGLAQALYGMTKEEALHKGVCISCKLLATWYSGAGEAEYRISGLCEPCFDKITGEPEEESMKIIGSDVSGTLQNDHALFAEKYLRREHFDDKWQAAFGSDPKREALHLLSVSRNELNPILLFMRKGQPNTGVDEQGNPRMQCSKIPPPTMQDLIDAGVPGYQHLLGDGKP